MLTEDQHRVLVLRVLAKLTGNTPEAALKTVTWSESTSCAEIVKQAEHEDLVLMPRRSCGRAGHTI